MGHGRDGTHAPSGITSPQSKTGREGGGRRRAAQGALQLTPPRSQPGSSCCYCCPSTTAADTAVPPASAPARRHLPGLQRRGRGRRRGRVFGGSSVTAPAALMLRSDAAAMEAVVAVSVTAMAMVMVMVALFGAVMVAGDPIFSAKVGHMTVPQDAQVTKLSVAMWPSKQDGSNPTTDAGHEPIIMTDPESGKKFLCNLPNVSAPRTQSQRDATSSGTGKAAVASDAAASATVGSGGGGGVDLGTRKTPEQLLEPMANLPCFYRVDGWWTYEFCYKKHIRQFHMEPKGEGKAEITMEFFLGMYDEDESRAAQKKYEARFAAEDKKRFHAQVYKGGTTCDLTGQLRRTEVRFFCEEGSQHNYMVSIKEAPTCHYEMLFSSALLCSHSNFRSAKQPIHFINCHEYPGSEGSSPSLPLTHPQAATPTAESEMKEGTEAVAEEPAGTERKREESAVVVEEEVEVAEEEGLPEAADVLDEMAEGDGGGTEEVYVDPEVEAIEEALNTL